MDYDVEKINKMFKGLTARKISSLSRLADLNKEELSIMRLKWLDNFSDSQICDSLGMSQSTLTRKRKVAHIKILDFLDLYGIEESANLSESLHDYNGLFFKCQDELIRIFVKSKNEDVLENVYFFLKALA